MLTPDPAKRLTASPLQISLRAFGVMDMLAFIAVVMPTAWMETGHQWSGLGPFPTATIVAYLARSGSLMYGLHGVFLCLLATDTVRYEKLIRWVAGVTVLHGVGMLAIDVVEQMPLWWTLVEGPAFSTTGIVVLVVQRYSMDRQSVPDSEPTAH